MFTSLVLWELTSMSFAIFYLFHRGLSVQNTGHSYGMPPNTPENLPCYATETLYRIIQSPVTDLLSLYLTCVRQRFSSSWLFSEKCFDVALCQKSAASSNLVLPQYTWIILKLGRTWMRWKPIKGSSLYFVHKSTTNYSPLAQVPLKKFTWQLFSLNSYGFR